MNFLRLYLMSLCCIASANVFVYGLTSDNDSKTSSSPSSSPENDQTKATKPRSAWPRNNYMHGSNKKLLNKLGMSKVRPPYSHNRKRLAVESRRHARPDDSHMFIIKLPPNLYYYTKTGTSSNSRSSASTAAKNNALDHGNGKKLSFNFNSNGKPGRIYHWNLPALEKILTDPRIVAKKHVKESLLDIKNTPTWTKPWENETIGKSYGPYNEKKSLKRKSPSYYAPSNAVNKNSFNKYFSGNGKPKSFYIMKGNQKKRAFKMVTP